MSKKKSLSLFFLIFSVLVILVFLFMFFFSKQELPENEMESGKEELSEELEEERKPTTVPDSYPSTSPSQEPTEELTTEPTMEPIKEGREESITYYTEEKIRGMNRTLDGFIETIYNYDTSQRFYYQGADIYMTKRGYQAILPFGVSDSEQNNVEGNKTTKQVVSRLQNTTYYYHFQSETECEVLCSVTFTTEPYGSTNSTQYTKLQLILQEDGVWQIDYCEQTSITNH